MAQIRQRFSHLEVRSIRGNLNTRLAKLEASNIENGGPADCHAFSALILAASGMERMGWKDKIGQILEPSEQLYAVGQGALAVECRTNDHATLSLLCALHDKVSSLRVIAERTLLRSLEGGCSAPVAVQSDYDADKETLSLIAGVWSLDGKKHILRSKTVDLKDLNDDDAPPPAKMQRRSSEEECRLYSGIVAQNVSSAELDIAEKLGEDVALELKEAGATPIMDEARAENELSTEEKLLKELGNVPGGSTCVAARLAIGVE
jgi:hydroxymethylbilane synthase